MPASPAMRCSPGRGPRADNHKRGHSLESGTVFKERDDDDLALFSEVQSRETDNFLLQSNHDFEDTFVTKLRHFSNHKPEITIAAREENNDLLNAEKEKNDYEWLITPPDTPLFSSLDDDAPQVILAQRGRPRAQPVSISRSYTMEKSHRSSIRGSASPNRLSLSPRSYEPTFRPRSRASSAPSSSPPPNIIIKPPTRSTRPSSPSSKPSSPPTSQRLSTRSASTTTVSRGNSASPKVRAWQGNIPGFSTEVPPNLRTSLADRPGSYTRGSSPPSRNGRLSKSPTASRSIHSSYSHERDRFSSHSKGSIASIVDDDVESFRSVTVDGSKRLSSRRVGGFRNNNNKAHISLKPNRMISSSSAPKRSFDLALRQMDHKKGPQNMFRPLLSSVPTSNFYAGKPSPAQNSSLTTSSNASSDLGTGESELNEDDATSEFVKLSDYIVDDEVFMSEKTDSLNEDIGNETLNFVEVDGLKDMLICSRCGCTYYVIVQTEDNVKLCANCQKSSDVKDHELVNTMKPRLTLVKVEPLELTSKGVAQLEQREDLSESFLSRHRLDECQPMQVSHQVISQPNEKSQHIVDFPKSTVDSLEEEGVSSQQFTSQPNEQSQHVVDFLKSTVGSLEGEGASIVLKRSSQTAISQPNEQVQPTVDFSKSTVDSSKSTVDSLEGEDVSVALKRSSQQLLSQPNEQIQQTVDFKKSTVDSFEEEGVSIMLKRSSQQLISQPNEQIQHIVDFPKSMVDSLKEGVSIVVKSQPNVQVQQTVDFIKSTVDSLEEGVSIILKSQPNEQIQQNVDFQKSTGDSLEREGISIVLKRSISIKGPAIRSGNFSASSISYDDFSYARDSTNSMRSSIGRGSMSTSSSVDFGPRFQKQLTSRKSDLEIYKNDLNVKHRHSVSSLSGTSTLDSFEVSTVTIEIDVADSASVGPQEIPSENLNVEEFASFQKVGDLSTDTRASTTCTVDEDISLVTEVEDLRKDTCALMTCTLEKVEDFSKDVAASVINCDTSNHSRNVIEEPMVLVKTQGGIMTLDEATNTILFCSSIVHNLAYNASTIATEKETVPDNNDSRPLIPAVGKGRNEVQNRKTSKKSSKSQKTRSRKGHNNTETDLSKTRIVYSNNKENTEPRKLESNCNCIIM